MNADGGTAPTRVVEVLGPAVGGIRFHVEELTKRLRGRGIDAVVVGPTRREAVVADIAAEIGSTRPAELVRSVRILHRAQADLLHAHGLRAGWSAVLGRRGRPVVLTAHNIVLDSAVMAYFERALYRRCDVVIAPSAAIAARVTVAAPRTTVRTIVPVSPVPEPTRSPTSIRGELGVGDAVLIVVPARLHPQKNHDLLLDALHRLGRTASAGRDGWRVVLAGDGPERERLARRVEQLGLQDLVNFLGHRADVADLIAAADLVVIPSRWEAIPLVAVEALLLGRPMVATDVGIVAEMGEAVRCVPVGDVEALTTALGELIATPALRHALSEHAFRVGAALVGPDHLVDQVLDVYAEALK